ncbi:diaminohydroxyphosphoribosylaminopyrimidine deaminase [Apibacter mensalis]|uniref:Riboflavin biosynthesis protein RibD n=1 Tax=Apibacter mensalis TaxID=1586267 RepID=A0A0X3ASB0_9FLAO|nr:bifunctional diaminohydroxyphosphoribosylaminopyrimidine deaminase/5-amino-6-(5-phosphoribosylamino)uracil reductase RibD [Apibacter mensalis]CVK16967.1 diaminohydroxyphosphoribosylaminopyrimidine deaminase [Apibacter mensalis]
MSKNVDEIYMLRCIDLAKNGLGTTYPNPLVGSVIVYNNKIIGEGWHRKSGEAHAEINAISSVKDPSILKNSTLYVSLEPCSHYGKTPPCALKIVDLKFKKVVVGITDPTSKVNGKGIELIRNSGIEVVTGILENECKKLNKRFITYHLKKRPYIILKWAETLNKKIDNGEDRNQPFWISNPFSIQKSHVVRNEEQSILVGKNTALIDNPNLTTRTIYGKNPIRLLIDKNLEIPLSHNILNEQADTFIFNKKISKSNNHLNYFKLNFDKDIIPQIIKILYDKNIQSVIVEGGERTLQHFIDLGIWDEAIIITSQTLIKNGTNAPTLYGEIINQELLGNNLISYLKNSSALY